MKSVAGAVPMAVTEGDRMMSRRAIIAPVLVAILISISGIAAAGDGYYTDRRSGCRLWTALFNEGATAQWSGGCKNGLAEGPGVLTLTNSSDEVRIEGSYVNGRLNGRVLSTYANGARFEGYVVEGIRNGRGRFAHPHMGYFDGEWRNGTPNGYGEAMIDKDCGCDLAGGRYAGEWVHGKRQGRGKFTKQNGDTYEGEWGNGLADGLGTYTWDHGTKHYSGKWAADCSLDANNRLYSFFQSAESCEVMRDYLTRWVR